jgi:hypothetical protein
MTQQYAHNRLQIAVHNAGSREPGDDYSITRFVIRTISEVQTCMSVNNTADQKTQYQTTRTGFIAGQRTGTGSCECGTEHSGFRGRLCHRVLCILHRLAERVTLEQRPVAAPLERRLDVHFTVGMLLSVF